MFKPYKLQTNALEIFRIKAHLRSYVKDPDSIDKNLLQNAAIELTKLPYKHKDPTDSIAKKMVLDAYHMGFLKYEDLTHPGCLMVKHEKYRRHPLISNRTHQIYMLKNRYTLKNA
jgi:hypothetical protein